MFPEIKRFKEQGGRIAFTKIFFFGQISLGKSVDFKYALGRQGAEGWRK